MDNMKLATVLKQLLKQRGMSVTELGSAVKVPPKTIYSWLNSGKSPRDIDQAKAIASYLKISLDELLYGDAPVVRPTTFEDFREEINAGTYQVILRKINCKELK